MNVLLPLLVRGNRQNKRIALIGSDHICAQN